MAHSTQRYEDDPTYTGDGIVLRGDARITYREVNAESRERVYTARRYETGEVAYFVNCRRVESLPATPLAMAVLERFATL